MLNSCNSPNYCCSRQSSSSSLTFVSLVTFFKAVVLFFIHLIFLTDFNFFVVAIDNEQLHLTRTIIDCLIFQIDITRFTIDQIVSSVGNKQLMVLLLINDRCDYINLFVIPNIYLYVNNNKIFFTCIFDILSCTVMYNTQQFNMVVLLSCMTTYN